MNARFMAVVVAGLLFAWSFELNADEQPVTSLADLEFWIGSGGNEALLTIDWDGDSPSDTALAWGYRWEGATNAESMLRDALQADDRLFAKLGANMGIGVPVYGVGYDDNDDGQFSIDDGTSFNSAGIATTGPSDLVESNDPADLYAEGWDLGFWHIATALENPQDGGTWTSATFGVSGIPLADGQWVSLAFTLDTESTTAVAENLLAAPAPFAPGDFQPDGAVDGLDLAIWQAGFGREGDVTQQTGDADGDLDVDGADFLLWQRNFSPARGNQFAGFAVPEPSTALLTSCGFILLLMIRSLDLETWRRSS